MKTFLILAMLTASLFLNPMRSAAQKPAKGKDYALLFAVDQYDDPHLPKLKYPVSDAREIKAELENIYGFECSLTVNPTKKQIKDSLLLYAQKFANGDYDKEGQLFIFFSGHGEREYGVGYFLTKDARIDNLESGAFSYATGRNMIDDIPCKHILVAIDACKSGSFDPRTQSLRGGDELFGRRGNELSEREIIIQEAGRLKTRLFVSSGAMDVSTPDKSDFAYCFLKALRSRGNVGNGADNNILTVNKLRFFLDPAKPSAMGGKFSDGDEAGSNFLFVAPTAKTVPTKFLISEEGFSYPAPKMTYKPPKPIISEFFNTNQEIDAAILVNAADNKANLREDVKTYLESKSLKASASFFKPIFLTKYAGRLNNDDIFVFNEIGAKENVRCVCLITPSNIQYKKNSSQGSAYTTASGSYDVKIFNLLKGDVSTFLISENGAGFNEARALESLESKFIGLFQQKFSKPESCKN